MGKGTVGGRAGRVGTVGLTGAPPEHERVGAETETSSQAHEPVSSRAQTEGSRPVQYTLRLSYDESDELDTLSRQLRKDAGRSVASAEVLRGLVAEAANDPDLFRRLSTRITSS